MEGRTPTADGSGADWLDLGKAERKKVRGEANEEGWRMGLYGK